MKRFRLALFGACLVASPSAVVAQERTVADPDPLTRIPASKRMLAISDVHPGFTLTPVVLQSNKRLSLARHVGVGAVTGVAVGLIAGRIMDSRCQDCTLSATGIYVPSGAVIGAVAGGLVFVMRRNAQEYDRQRPATDPRAELPMMR